MQFDQWKDLSAGLQWPETKSKLDVAEELLHRGPQHWTRKPTKAELETHIYELQAELRRCVDIAKRKTADVEVEYNARMDDRIQLARLRRQYRDLWEAADCALSIAKSPGYPDAEDSDDGY